MKISKGKSKHIQGSLNVVPPTRHAWTNKITKIILIHKIINQAQISGIKFPNCQTLFPQNVQIELQLKNTLFYNTNVLTFFFHEE